MWHEVLRAVGAVLLALLGIGVILAIFVTGVVLGAREEVKRLRAQYKAKYPETEGFDNI